jgi:hypothetical protein
LQIAELVNGTDEKAAAKGHSGAMFRSVQCNS